MPCGAMKAAEACVRELGKQGCLLPMPGPSRGRGKTRGKGNSSSLIMQALTTMSKDTTGQLHKLCKKDSRVGRDSKKQSLRRKKSPCWVGAAMPAALQMAHQVQGQSPALTFYSFSWQDYTLQSAGM